MISTDWVNNQVMHRTKPDGRGKFTASGSAKDWLSRIDPVLIVTYSCAGKV